MNHPVKRGKILMHLKKLNADIAFLQETHLRTADHFRLKGGWIGHTFHSNFNSKSRGVAILINKNISFTVSSVRTDPFGRYVIVVGQLYTMPVILANIYAPNWDDPNFFTDFFTCIPRLSTHHLILGGDMNCVLSPVLDRSSPKPITLTRSAHSIHSFLKSYGIADVWRFRNPTSRGYSFYSPVHHTYSRIDYFFTDKRLLPYITKCDYKAIVISDHAPLCMKMYIPNKQSNYRPWRFNPLLLSEAAFVDFISSEIKFFLTVNQTPGMSSLTVWEALKAYLRGQVISYCAKRKKAETMRLNKLAEEMLEIDRLNSLSPSPTLRNDRILIQTEFDLLSTRQIEFLLLKSRQKTYEHGEKAGRLLANQIGRAHV